MAPRSESDMMYIWLVCTLWYNRKGINEDKHVLLLLKYSDDGDINTVRNRITAARTNVFPLPLILTRDRKSYENSMLEGCGKILPLFRAVEALNNCTGQFHVDKEIRSFCANYIHFSGKANEDLRESTWESGLGALCLVHRERLSHISE